VPGMSALTITVETITPQTAKEWLAKNSVNRKLRRARVAMYAKQMKAGKWRLTGETIVFSPDGLLLQGQHRLAACIESQTEFESIVVRGIPVEAMALMDSGLARSAGDTLSLVHVTNPNNTAAVIRLILGVQGGFVTDTSKMSLITRDEMMDFSVEYVDDVHAAMHLADATRRTLRHSTAAWAALAYLLMEADDEMSVEFFRGLATGADLEAGDPRLALRTYCLTAYATRKKMTAAEVIANGIRQWNNWIDGRKVASIKSWRVAYPWPKVDS
jgi:hypothetical protein